MRRLFCGTAPESPRDADWPKKKKLFRIPGLYPRFIPRARKSARRHLFWTVPTRPHPYLKRKAIYLSPLHIKTIGDLSADDSFALMQALTDHATQADHVYRHTWSIGDLVMWDNTSIMHSRTPMPADQKRYLKRTGFYLPDELAVPF